MNRDEAKEILKLYRPGSADAADADFTEALELARNDSELKRELDTHCANYEIIRGRLKKISIPAGLKEQILAEKPPVAETSSGKILRPNFWRNRTLAAVAAALVVVAAIFFWIQPRRSEELNRYRTRMVSTALRAYQMDLETTNLVEVREFLARHNAPANYALPSALENAMSTGCVVLRWENQPVSMICFRSGRPLSPTEKSDLFLFVADRSALPNFSGNSRKFEQVGRAATATWVEGEKVYLLATRGDAEFLRKFL